MATAPPRHEYSPGAALDLLLQRIMRANQELATRIRQVIDAGTIDSVMEQRSARGKKKRSFLKARPFTDEEAIEVALNALRAYFVELPACMDAANTEFIKTAVRGSAAWWEGPPSISASGQAKVIQIEVVPETAKFGTDASALVSMESPDAEVLEQQRQNMLRLKDLLTFN